MLVPNFNDIGKRIKDLFEKNFPAGFFKVSANLPKQSDIALNLSGSQNIDSGKLVSTLETKINLRLANKDVLLTEKWTASNEIQSILEVSVVDHLKSIIELDFEPSSGRKSMKFKNNYTSEIVNFSGDLECRQIEPILTLSSMFKFLPSIPLYGGALGSFDTYKQKFARIAYAAQFSTDQTCLAASLTNHNDLLAQGAHKVASGTDLGFEVGWKIDNKTPRFGLVMKHNLSSETSIKTKLDNSGDISLAYTFLAREGITVTFGVKLDSKNINGGGHKLGLQIEL